MNRYQPHVLVLPEDAENRKLANGFLMDQSLSLFKIKVEDEAGGWIEVLHRFKTVYVDGMIRFPSRMMVLLIDFDARGDRLEEAKKEIPEGLRDRVFVLGAWKDPEHLKRALGSCEEIGLALARDCREETNITWGHELLRHNASELERLREHVRPILFSAPGTR